MNRFSVSYKDFSEENAVDAPIETKNSKPKPPADNPNGDPVSVQYNETEYLYKYTKEVETPVRKEDGTVVTEKRTIHGTAPLLIDGPEMYSPSGVLKKMNGAYEAASIFVQFDLTKEDIREFVSVPPTDPNTGMALIDPATGKPTRGGTVDRMYRGALKRIFAARGQLPSLARINSLVALEGAAKYPIYFTRDPNTSQIVQGKNPSCYFPLLCYGKPGSFSRRETKFTVPVEDPANPGQCMVVPWEMLSNVEMRFIPQIQIKKIYIGGGKVSIQWEIVSAVITYIAPASGASGQQELLKKMQVDISAVESIRSQIERLTTTFRAAQALKKPEEAAPPAKQDGKPEETKPAAAAQPLPLPLPLPAPSQTSPPPPVPTSPPALPGMPTVAPLPLVPGVPSVPPQLAALMAASNPTLPSAPIGVPALPAQ